MLAEACARRLGAQQRGHSAVAAVGCGSLRHCRSGRCCIVEVGAGVGERETAVSLVLVGSGDMSLAAAVAPRASRKAQVKFLGSAASGKGRGDCLLEEPKVYVPARSAAFRYMYV